MSRIIGTNQLGARQNYWVMGCRSGLDQYYPDHLCDTTPLLHVMSRRNWLFTLNNPSQSPPELCDLLRQRCRFFVFQLERGESGTPHYQGYVVLPKAQRLSWLRSMLGGAHWEERRGTHDDAKAYCSKEETRVDGPWTGGEDCAPGRRTDLEQVAQLIRESGAAGLKRVRDENPAMLVKFGRGLRELAVVSATGGKRPDLEVILLYGPTGCGKTRHVHEAVAEEELYRTPPGTGFWFDGYLGEEDVLIDDFAGARSKWQLGDLLQILDIYPIRVPTKGGFIPWTPKRIWITTNIHPIEWYNYAGREEHYRALVRRFSRVIRWKSLDERDDDGMSRGVLADWLGHRFWLGPPVVSPPVLGPMDDYIVVEPVDKYNF